jgi:two-component system NtrC family sensor kinase
MAGDGNKEKQTESLAALGQVAAGVTHEVRNVMTGILGFAQVARRRLDDKPEAACELLGLIEKETQRCVDILTQFLSFTRPRGAPKVPVDVGEVIVSVGKLTNHQLNMNRVKLEVELEPALPLALADPSALKQVVLNLVLNAMHAVGDKGGHVQLRGRRGGDGMLELSVSDDGPGVAGDVAERIFEPFFTTKPVGQGSGMGLAVSREIVEEHGGTLRLEPPGAGGGAVFMIRLPVYGG